MPLTAYWVAKCDFCGDEVAAYADELPSKSDAETALQNAGWVLTPQLLCDTCSGSQSITEVVAEREPDSE